MFVGKNNFVYINIIIYKQYEKNLRFNCRATVHLPVAFYPDVSDRAGILQVVREKDSWKVELGSGNYLFER